MRSRIMIVLCFMLVALVVLAIPASAHEDREVEGHEIVVGWLDEPAYAGFKNAVQFVAHHGKEPVEGAKLEVEVLFGDQDSTTSTGPMPLEAAWDTPGEYHAYLIPTEPGTYTFHVTGQLEKGEEFDEYFTSGEDTFSNIENPADIEFPAVVSADDATATAAPVPSDAAESDTAASGGSDTLAIIAIAVGAVALVVALVAVGKKRSG